MRNITRALGNARLWIGEFFLTLWPGNQAGSCIWIFFCICISISGRNCVFFIGIYGCDVIYICMCGLKNSYSHLSCGLTIKLAFVLSLPSLFSIRHSYTPSISIVQSSMWRQELVWLVVIFTFSDSSNLLPL